VKIKKGGVRVSGNVLSGGPGNQYSEIVSSGLLAVAVGGGLDEGGKSGY